MNNNRGSLRRSKVEDALCRAISKILLEDFKDPRLGLVTVLDADVSPDFTSVKVYVTFMELEKVSLFIKILNNAAGFFRSELARSLQLRTIPKPRFIFDDSMLKGSHIDKLLEHL